MFRVSFSQPERPLKAVNISARDGLYSFPWNLGKRDPKSNDKHGLFHQVLVKGPSKRSPDADPGGVSLSVTANMDTLRERLLWSLKNNHRQVERPKKGYLMLSTLYYYLVQSS